MYTIVSTRQCLVFASCIFLIRSLYEGLGVTNPQTNPVTCNAELQGEAIRKTSLATKDALSALREIMQRYSLSGRSWARILKVSRTIADLEGSERVHVEHIMESSSFRLDSSPS